MAACLYLIPCRTDLVEILDTFQYNDSLNDIFQREPFSVLIRSKEAGRGTYLHPADFSLCLGREWETYYSLACYEGESVHKPPLL